jgi:GntR family transcriptional regulator/MocR family aminotransferase
MELHVQLQGNTDLSGQVYRGIAAAIRDGRLQQGQQLPPSRLLAGQLGISRKPVAEAYARLSNERLIVGHIGKGSFVSGERAPSPGDAAPFEQASAALQANAALAWWRQLPTPLRHPMPEGHSRYEFLPGRPTPGHFPHEAWRRCLLAALRTKGAAPGHYGDAAGVPALRDAIARHIGFARGVRCSSTEIIVTNGAQQAFDLLARLTVQPGDVVAMEDPGYPMARLLFAAHGARVVSIGVDHEGMMAATIPPETRLIYTTPAHQFPLGMPMSQARREQLLARAAHIGALIIEDDYDSEFRYEGRPTDSLQSLDQHGVVAFVGSFSKVMLPELRLGYIVAPPALVQPLLAAKHVADWHSPVTVQTALARFIDDGLLLKHIRRGHAIYATRREELMRLFAGPLSPWFRLVPNTAGFHAAAIATESIDIAVLQRLARRVDVGLYALADFYTERAPQRGLFLGYGAIETLDIETALLRVRDVLQEMQPRA